MPRDAIIYGGVMRAGALICARAGDERAQSEAKRERGAERASSASGARAAKRDELFVARYMMFLISCR